MKSWRCHDEIRAGSDEIFGIPPQMKLNPSLSPREAGFHREAISSTEGGFIPSVRTDLAEKRQVCNYHRKNYRIFNEIVLCTMKSSLRSDEIFSLRLQMKLNPPPLTLRSKISSRSDFIHRRWISSANSGFS